MFHNWWWDAVKKADAEKPDAEAVPMSDYKRDDAKEKHDGD